MERLLCFANIPGFTDDFSYYRDELWRATSGVEYSIDVDRFDTTSDLQYLRSFPPFTGPFRIDFIISNPTNSTQCGGYDFQFINLNESQSVFRAFWDCTTANITFVNNDDTDSAASFTNDTLTGYIMYRPDAGDDAIIYFKAHDDADLLNVSITDGSYSTSRALYFGLYDAKSAASKYIEFESLSMTSFVDWFTAHSVRSDLWSTFPSEYNHSGYASTYFTSLDPMNNRYFMEFEYPQTLESNATLFQFISPMTISMVYGTTSLSGTAPSNSNGNYSRFTVSLTTSTNKSSLFVADNDEYPATTMLIEFGGESGDSLSIKSNVDNAADQEIASEAYAVSDDAICSVNGEHLVEISISENNISVTVYNGDLTVCAELEISGNDTDIFDVSSMNWNSLSIAPLENSFVSISYFAVTAGVAENVETEAPSSAPTSAPTVLCTYEGQSYGLNDTVIASCAFGFYGAGDSATCQVDGDLSEWTEGCFRTSFSDHFVDFDDLLWSVEETEGVSGDAALATDGTEAFRFIPDDASLVGRIRSRDRIVWPMRARAVVEKREDECNLWSIALGPTWDTRSTYSARVNWQCLGGSDNKQMSLYNATFRLYDSRCWNANETDTMEVVFSIRNAGPDKGAKVTTTTTDCASLALQITDILSQSPWEAAYLWFGSYGTSEDSDLVDRISDNTPIIGRFYSMLYTQFWTDFDTLMPQIWDSNASTLSAAERETDKGKLYVAPEEHLVADSELFQFEIPFALKLGIQRPDPTSASDGTWTSGKYAHFVTVGRAEYVLDAEDIGEDEDVLQMVWDGTVGARLVYAPSGLWETGLDDSSYCEWDLQNVVQEVTIYVDSLKVTIVDDLCDGNNMTVTHGLNATARFMNLSIGFIEPRNKEYGDSNRIAFSYIEAYQYSTTEYAGRLADDNDDEAQSVANLEDVYPDATSEMTILGIPIIYFVIALCVVVLCCCVLYCAVAWNRRCFPFRKERDGMTADHHVTSNSVIKRAPDSDMNVVKRGADGLPTNGMLNGNLQQQLIPDKSSEDPNGNGYGHPHPHQFQGGPNPYGQYPIGGGMGGGPGPHDPTQQQLFIQQMQIQQAFYQQQFMQMMMANPQQQAILLNMSPPQRKQYIQNQMMIYMQRITAMQQHQMIPMQQIQQMQQQYMESNPNDGEGGAEGTGDDTGFLEGGMPTNAMVNLGYGRQGGGNGQGVEMQPMQPQHVDILTEFMQRVPLETVYMMCPVGQDGQKRSDTNRARMMIAQFRGVAPNQVDENDPAIAYFEYLTMHELKGQLKDLPGEIYELLKGSDYRPRLSVSAGNIDFLVEFTENVNLKSIFGDLEADLGYKGAPLDVHHARIVIAKLRNTAYAQVSENDPGVKLMVNKNMTELRMYLQDLPLADLRLLDLKAYHNYRANAQSQMNGGGGGFGGPNQHNLSPVMQHQPQRPKVSGIVFPTIKLNYNGDVRHFKVPKFGCFNEIMSFISGEWPFLSQYKLMYQDVSRQQWIRITTNIDVQECIKNAVDRNSQFVEISIFR